jgi:hypothetical protein
MRRLPLLTAGLVTVGAIYTLRGLLIIPQLVAALRHPGLIPWQFFLFSGMSLVLGLAHLAGTFGRWRELTGSESNAC